MSGPKVLAKRNPRLPVYKPVAGPGSRLLGRPMAGPNLRPAGISIEEAIELFDDPEGRVTEDVELEDRYESD